VEIGWCMDRGGFTYEQAREDGDWGEWLGVAVEEDHVSPAGVADQFWGMREIPGWKGTVHACKRYENW
jgi:hypothetical protein